MTKEEIIQKLHTAMTDARGQESHFESWMTLNEGICDAIDALKALDKQEPVAWMNDNTPSGIFARHIDGARNFGCTIPLYTTPPQRRWVGLTDEEIIAINMSTVTKLIDEPIVCDTDHNIIQLGKAIEAKLKQKNGYSEE